MTFSRLLVAMVAAIGCMSTSLLAGEFADNYYFPNVAKLRAMEGKPAPALKLKDWIGPKQDLSKLKGSVVVVDFWATWCGPCMNAIPHNVALYNKHKDDGLVILGVHDSRRGQDKMAQVAKQQKINYPLAVDDGGASVKAYNLSFWPTYVVIDRQGVVRAAGLTPPSVDKVVAKLLAEEAPSKSNKPDAPAKQPTARKPAEPKPAPSEAKPAPVAAAPPKSASSTSGIPSEWLERDPATVKPLAALLNAGSPPAIASENWLNTEALSLEGLKGKVVMLDFWATWCGPCLASVPRINELADKYGKDGLVIIGVCHPRGVEKMAQTAKNLKMKYALCADAEGVINKAYAVDSYPDYYFIDRAGRLRIADCSNTRIEDAIQLLLAEK